MSILLLHLFSIEAFGQSGIYDKIGIDVRHGLHGAVPEENIDLFTGNLTMRNLDIVLSGPNGFDLKVWRVYNSKIVQDRLATDTWQVQQDPYSPVGLGWTMHMGRLHGASSETPSIEFPDGRWETAYEDKNNTALHITRDFLKYDNTVKKLHFKDGVVWTFGALNESIYLVTEIENSYGHKITIQYISGTNKLLKIFDSLGREINFTYNGNKLTQIDLKNSTGQTIYYNYTVETFPGGYHKLTSFDAPEIPAVRYEYEDGSSDRYKLTAINTAFGGRMEYYYQDHTFYYQTYSLQTRVVYQKRIRFGNSGSFSTWYYSYPDYNQTPTGVVTVDGPVYDTQVTYNAYSAGTPWKVGLIKKKQFTDGSFTQETEWETFQISTKRWIVLSQDMGYIQAPRVSKTTTSRAGDATAVEEYLYERADVEKYGLPTRIKYYGGTSGTTFLGYKTMAYYFETNSEFLNKHMLTHLWKESIYDGSTEVKKTENAYYDTVGKHGALDWVKRWHGDTWLTWDYTYTGNTPNDITVTIDLPGGGAGLETYKYSYGVLAQLMRPGYTELTRTISVHNSAILSETNQHGGKMDFTYDDLDRITNITMPAGFNGISAAWANNQVTINQGNYAMIKFWDGMGRDTGSQESGDNTTLYYRKELDAEGRLLNESKGSTNVSDKYVYVMNNSGSVTKITDPRGKVTEITYSGDTKTIKDAENNTTVFYYQYLPGKFSKMKDTEGRYAIYTYDGIGRLEEVSYDGNARKQIYTYDAMDQLTDETHPETGTISYVYNSENNLVTKTWDNKIITYTYNTANQLKNMNAVDVNVEYGYDSRGRLDKVIGSTGWKRELITYNTMGSITGERQDYPILGYLSMSYDYDGNNNLKSVTYPNGKTLSMVNNSLNMPETATFYGKSLVSQVSYGIHKQPLSMTISGNGTDVSASYNSMGFLSHTDLKKGGIAHYEANYGYDNVGNITSVYNTTPSLDGSFGYDDLYRLTSASYTGGNSYTYDHDNYGNLELATVNGTTVFNRTYTNKNRISHNQFIYDGRGNLTQDLSFQYVWDNQNRLSEIKKSTGETVSTHLYNERGLRMKSSRAADPALLITFPRGGEIFSRGMPIAITWSNPQNLTGNVKIHLLQGASEILQLTAGTPISDATWLWNIPLTLAEGDYNIRISLSDDSVSSSSAVFNISGTLTPIEFDAMSGTAIVTGVGNSMAAGWLDYNGDKHLDLYVSNYAQRNHLFLNNGNDSFTQVDNGTFDPSSQNSRAALWGDFNNNDLPDIFVANANQNNQLFEYDGQIWDDSDYGLGSDSGNSYSAAWADYNNDGYLDLYVANYQAANFLYLGEGSNGFTAVTNSPVVSSSDASRNARWCDYDQDGDADLFVVNYNANNALYRNDGLAGFTKISSGDMVNDNGKSTDCAWGDYDNDQDMDLFVSNGEGENNFLYRNENDGGFTRIQQGNIVADGGDSIGCRWLDMDNDGDLDLLVVNTNEANFVYQNIGDGNFLKISTSTLAANSTDSRGITVGDYDQDGDCDIYIGNYGVNSMFRNNAAANGNHWISVRCNGKATDVEGGGEEIPQVSATAYTNKKGVGATVLVKAVINGTSQWQIREISDRNSYTAHFGLGDATAIEEVLVRWPSGKSHSASFEGDQTNYSLLVGEPDSTGFTLLTPNGGEILAVGDVFSITWDSSGTIDGVAMSFSTDKGTSWSSIGSFSNTGTYNWTVPNSPSTDCMIKVQATNNQYLYDISPEFTILPDSTPTITVTSPVSGDHLVRSKIHIITWATYNLEGDISIDFSADSGQTWSSIVTDTPNNGSYHWTVPDTLSTSCMVKVKGANGTPNHSSGLFSISDLPAPFITVTSPTGADEWQKGWYRDITWESSQAGDYVKIEFSANGGITWLTINSYAENNGSYEWFVWNIPSELCLIRISSTDGSLSDVNDSPFTIRQFIPPEITILSPNGGENFMAFSQQEIKWTSKGNIGNVEIHYAHGGAIRPWYLITNGTENDGSFTWNVPNDPGDIYLMVKYGNTYDYSDSAINIIPPPPEIIVISPNGNETLEAKSTYTIIWGSLSIPGTVDIEYSIDGGSTWDGVTQQAGNTGSFNWVVPLNISNNCKVRVFETGGDTLDESDGLFAIVPIPAVTVTSPNGGESLEAGSNHEITWTSVGAVGNVNVEYSLDSGSNWSDIASNIVNTGRYYWTVAGVESDACRVRVYNNISGAVDQSDADFSIVPKPGITVTSPNGGEILESGSYHTITWTSTGRVTEVTIQYSTTNRSTWKDIVADIPDSGSYNWTVPDTASDACRVRVLARNGAIDRSDDLFTITPVPTVTVTAPNGNENWNAGTQQDITWSTQGILGDLSIQYSTDSGGTWTEISAAAENNGLFPWTVPDDVSDLCLVRVREADDGSPWDVSDAEFSILPASTITVTAPNGGEYLEVFTDYTITWTASGNALTVAIDYSVDNGVNWLEITADTENDGSYEWTLPDTPSQYSLVRIKAGNGDTDRLDISDSAFTILSDTSLCGTVWRNGDYSGNALYCAAYGNSVYVAAGTTGNIFTSPDAIHWKSQTALGADTIRAIGFAGDIFVAVGDNGTIFTSSSGTDWSPQSSGTSANLYALAYGNRWLVAVGAGGTVLTSVDGFTWTPVTSGTASALHCVTYGNGSFVAGGTDGTIITSSNSTTWSLRDSGGVTDTLRAAAFGNDTFLLAGGSDALLTSIKGSDWQAASFTGSNSLNAVAYGSNRFVIAGDNGKIFSSPDAETWTERISNTANPLYGIIYANQRFAAVGISSHYSLCGTGVPAVTLTSPNGGETLVVDDMFTVSWNSFGIAGDLDIDYSADNGASWNTVASIAANTGSYDWTVPNDVSTTCLLRLTADGGTPMDVSDGVFEITTVPLPTLTLIAPNGAESWQAGSLQQIAWSSTGTIDNITIELSIDNGSSWQDISASTPNDGSFDWTVPELPSQQCMLRITGTGIPGSDFEPVDSSDDPFTILSSVSETITLTAPNGRESLTVGSQASITWDSTGSIDDINIQCSLDSGASWTEISGSTANDGLFEWTVPDTVSNRCIVQITGYVNPDTGSGSETEVTDQSDDLFSIVSPTQPTITVTAPNGGETWIKGSSHAVTWIAAQVTDPIYIDYSADNGATWQEVAAAVENSGTYMWTVADDVSSTCLVRVSSGSPGAEPLDVSNQVFEIAPAPTITLTVPNGAESWQAGSFETITWTSTGGAVNTVHIQYSMDNGATWTDIDEGVENSGSFQWFVPDTPSANCLVQVKEAGSDEGPVDGSDAVFTIVSAPDPVILVTAPNGGETFTPGMTCDITWLVAGSVTETRLEISTDNGSTWTEIAVADTADSSYTWTVPDTPSDQCLIRAGETDGQPQDVSDAVFSIVAAAPDTLTLTSVNGGEVLTAGDAQDITWTVSGSILQIAIAFSHDSGASWTDVTVADAADESYTWTVPDMPSETCLIRISDTNEGSLLGDESDAVFSIVPAGAAITVISPNGGEGLAVGMVQQINWDTQGIIDNISIDFSTTNGNIWITIADAVTNTGSYDWNVPDTPSETCLIRVRGSDSDDDPSDDSDNTFSIVTDNMGCVQNWVTDVSGMENFHAVTWGNSTYVAVADNGVIYADTIGSSWSAQSSGTGSHLYGITYGNGLFVTVGQGGEVLTSPDGFTWTIQVSGISDDLYAVAFGGNMFVATGSGGAIVTGSSDGVTWTTRNSGTGAGLNDILFSGSTFAAAGNGGTILTSPNGSVWTAQSSVVSKNLRAVAYGDGLFVAAGDDGLILTSSNGSTWTAREAGVNDGFLGAAWGNGNFVLVGKSGKIITSTDALAWFTRSSTLRNDINGIFYYNKRFTAAANGALIFSACEAASASEMQTQADANLDNYQLRLLTPNGNDVLYANEKYLIRWQNQSQQNRPQYVRLEYTPDNGINWFTINPKAPNTGTYPWRVPHHFSNNCRIRISNPVNTQPGHRDAVSAPTFEQVYQYKIKFKVPSTCDAGELFTVWLGDASRKTTVSSVPAVSIIKESDGTLYMEMAGNRSQLHTRSPGRHSNKWQRLKIQYNPTLQTASLWLDGQLIFNYLQLPANTFDPAISFALGKTATNQINVADLDVSIMDTSATRNGFLPLFNEKFENGLHGNLQQNSGWKKVSQGIANEKNIMVKRFSLPIHFPFDISDSTFEIRYNKPMENSITGHSQMHDSPGSGPNTENSSFKNSIPTRNTTQSPTTTDTYYVYSFDNKLLAEYDHIGTCVKNYLYLGNRLLAVYFPQTDTYRYHMSDQINSTRIVTDDNGDVVHSAAYGPFGEPQKTWTNTYEPKLKFSGKERETYSGLDYFGARFYDSATYRFNSVDPIINKDEALVNPQLWNLYAYCDNNPITFLDPDGRLKRKKNGKLKFRGTRIAKITHPSNPKKKVKVKLGYLFADDGSIVNAFKNKSKDRKYDTDCHGVTFADGEYFINNPEVSTILKGDNYSQVTTPIVGNIIVYYDVTGAIVHSATVVEVKKSGQVIVQGLGGLDINTKKTTARGGWNEPNASYKYYQKK